MSQNRINELQSHMADQGIDAFVINDADSIYFFAHVWGYLGMEFGRATIVVVPREGAPSVITPAMEAEMVRTMTWVSDVREWSDGVEREWVGPLDDILKKQGAKSVAVEYDKTHPRVLDALAEVTGRGNITDQTRIISEIRMIKSASEIATMRQAGQVAVAMGEGGRDAIAEGEPEYEVALAVIAAGTRKAAEFLKDDKDSYLVSPTIYNLQVMQSGRHTCLVHGRSTTKRFEKGDPVYLCFCGIANFKQFKLGFDREFFVGSVSDQQARLYETSVKAQQTALAEVRPGAIAEDINTAAEEVYLSAGLGNAYRTGRGIGYSFLEEPQLKRGDRTPLQAGMTFAVDGGITIAGEYGARIGDSIVVTENGFEYLTNMRRELTIV